MIEELREKWFDLAHKYAKDKKLIEDLFGLLVKSYSASDRHYHDLQHIHAMLKGAEEWRDKADDFDSLCFAIWFHDVVYDSLKHDNEEKSAEVAGEALRKMNYPPGKIAKVKQMILRTKEHMKKMNDDTDTSILLDLDLVILGADRERYKEYMKQVREEYGWVPGIMYRQGRKKVLQQFLDSERIYRLDDFRKRLEDKARENLRYELQELS